MELWAGTMKMEGYLNGLSRDSRRSGDKTPLSHGGEGGDGDDWSAIDPKGPAMRHAPCAMLASRSTCKYGVQRLKMEQVCIAGRHGGMARWQHAVRHDSLLGPSVV